MELLTMGVVPIINENNTISVSVCADGINILGLSHFVT